MNKWLADLKQLDPKNPGGWPWPFKIIAMLLIFVLIMVAGYFLSFQSQLENLEKEEKKEADLKTVFVEKKKLAINLEAYQQQRAEIEQSFGALLKQLPTRSEMDALLIDINQAGLGRGLQFDLFKPAPSDNVTEFYAERPISLKVNGNYHDLGAFASDISKLPRIVLLIFLRAGILSVHGDAQVILRAHDSASAPAAPLIAAAQYGAGRVVVLADSDLFGDDDLGHFDHRALWLNVCYWVAYHAFTQGEKSAQPALHERYTGWSSLKDATNALRLLQKADGSLTDEAMRAQATALVQQMQRAIQALQPHFLHEQNYLDAVCRDLQAWVDGGCAKPDFGQSLALFRPEKHRADNIENLVVFPLYTPNGSAETRFEALITRTPWPEWLRTLERTQFDNGKFVPVHFVDYTDGYHSECAVLFPETVSLTGKPSNNFGGIFCDREATRFQRVVSAACWVMNVNLPPQASAFLQSSDLIRDTFALWDLIHDRWHSHGELPFDPFMIRQRLPYWMYSLEELRVDLQTFGSASTLEQGGFPFARYVKYGILFDRIFRFPITGNRVRNYDGLGGQLLFAFLHKQGCVSWRDNALTLDWAHIDAGVSVLREKIEQLYRNGIDMTKIQYWLAAHDLVSEWVKPNLGSKWAKDTRVLSDESQPKEWINRVLDDEFPLSLFYLQLQKKLAA